MSDNKSYMQTEYELKEEIKSINDKGFNTVLIRDKDQRDKRRFTKIFQNGDCLLLERVASVTRSKSLYTSTSSNELSFSVLSLNRNTTTKVPKYYV